MTSFGVKFKQAENNPVASFDVRPREIETKKTMASLFGKVKEIPQTDKNFTKLDSKTTSPSTIIVQTQVEQKYSPSPPKRYFNTKSNDMSDPLSEPYLENANTNRSSMSKTNYQPRIDLHNNSKNSSNMEYANRGFHETRPRSFENEAIIERKIIRHQTTAPNTNTLVFYVTKLRDDIINRAQAPIPMNITDEDAERMKTFKIKFIDQQESWHGLMNHIIKQLELVDKKYKSETEDYFGIKEQLISEILNISLSYLIIGGETKSGNGIDNCKGTADMSTNIGNRPTIRNKIKLFLRILPEKINLVAKNHQNRKQLDSNHSKFLHEKGTIVSYIESLRKTIKTQEKDIQKIKDADARESVMESLNENKDHLKQSLIKLKTIEENINNVIANKNNEMIIMRTTICELFQVIDFSYFMHDDWCSALDHGLLSDRKTF